MIPAPNRDFVGTAVRTTIRACRDVIIPVGQEQTEEPAIRQNVAAVSRADNV